MTARPDLTEALALAIAEATRSLDQSTETGREQAVHVAALTARQTLADHVKAYTAALIESCADLGHRGAVRATDTAPGRPCRVCSAQVRHTRRVAELLAPNDA